MDNALPFGLLEENAQKADIQAEMAFFIRNPLRTLNGYSLADQRRVKGEAADTFDWESTNNAISLAKQIQAITNITLRLNKLTVHHEESVADAITNLLNQLREVVSANESRFNGFVAGNLIKDYVKRVEGGGIEATTSSPIEKPITTELRFLNEGLDNMSAAFADIYQYETWRDAVYQFWYRALTNILGAGLVATADSHSDLTLAIINNSRLQEMLNPNLFVETKKETYEA